MSRTQSLCHFDAQDLHSNPWYHPFSINLALPDDLLTACLTYIIPPHRSPQGKNWKEIAQKMNRNTNSVRDHYRFVISRREACGTQLHMQWTKEEEDKLAELVYQSLGVPPGSDVTGGVKWEMIASKMQFRTALQCSQKWSVPAPRPLCPRLHLMLDFIPCFVLNSSLSAQGLRDTVCTIESEVLGV